MSDKLEVPRLKAKKDWYVGLNPEPVDHSHPDVHDDQLIQEAALHSIPRTSFCFIKVLYKNHGKLFRSCD